MSDKNALLYNASFHGHLSKVQSCLAKGANVNKKNNRNGWTPLIAAAANNQTPVMRVLLKCQNLDIGATTKTGMTVLHMACYNGYSNCVRMLGKDRRMTQSIINAKDSDGKTARMLIAKHGTRRCQEEMAKLEGVDVEWDTGNGSNLKDVVRKSGCFSENLYNASKAGDLATVQACLAAGVDVNARQSNGWTPLIAALAYKHSQVVTALLSCQNIGISTTTDYGRTVLHWACWYGSSECVALLGKDRRMEHMINAKDTNGDTALVLAVEQGYLACVEEMAKLNGVDWETKSGNGKSLEDIAR